MTYAGAPPPYSQVSASDPGIIVNPNIPYVGQLNQLCDGFMITVTGRVFPKADRFEVNLALGHGQSEIAYHLNPRFQEKQVVRNSKLGGNWGREERGGAFTLQTDQNFELSILVTNSCYKTAFNGKHFCEFVHRIPKERVDHLVIRGDIMINQIKITDPRKPVTYAAPAAGFVSVTYPTGPQGFPGHPAPPVAGYPSPQAPGYPAPQGYPVAPQGYPAAPQGYPATPQGYPAPPQPQGYPGAAGAPPIAVHIHPTTAEYPGKAPAPAAAYPHPAKPKPKPSKPTIALPHLQPLPKAAEPGTVIRVQGMPKLNAKNFRFDFLAVNKENIAFHFNPRFGENVVVRNTKKGGAWGHEERQQSKFPFTPGKEFNVIIFVDPEKFQVTVNGENFITYNHRFPKLDRIRTFKVDGDVDLYSLQI